MAELAKLITRFRDQINSLDEREQKPPFIAIIELKKGHCEFKVKLQKDGVKLGWITYIVKILEEGTTTIDGTLADGKPDKQVTDESSQIVWFKWMTGRILAPALRYMPIAEEAPV